MIEAIFLGQGLFGFNHRPQSNSFWGFPYRILNMNPKKKLLWGLWVEIRELVVGV